MQTVGLHQHELPRDIGQLSNLVSLKLSSNKLVNLPDSFGQLGKLKELVFMECNILLELPNSFSSLSSLETLFIYGGASLLDLPPGFETLPKLRTLYLFNCVFTSLPDEFGDLPSLEVLRVGTKATYSRNRLETGSESDYGDELEGACALHMLPQSLVCLIGLVKNCPQLRLFPSLLSTPIHTPSGDSSTLGTDLPAAAADAAAADADADAGAAATGAPPFPSLEQLEISDCPRLESLPEGLHLLPRLEHLALEDCTNLKPTHPSPLLPPTSPPPQNNTILSALSPPSTSSSPPLVAPISLPSSIKTVILSNVFQSAQFLSESLLSLSQLTHLNIYDLPSL
ncbi:unnamed protein product [Closterium sp. NIES-53]